MQRGEPPAGLSPLGAALRREDPDRFLTALFAPPARREALFLLYAFNNELARARLAAREDLIALMRLQWWREVVEGAPRAHVVATPLRAALTEGRLPADELLRMIAGREAAIEAPPDGLEACCAQLLEAQGSVAAAAGFLLGADATEREQLRGIGAAYGAAGAIRLARRNPAGPQPPAGLEAAVWQWLKAGGSLRRAIRPAGLVAALAARDISRPDAAARPRGLSDKLSVLRLAFTGRIDAPR